MNNEDNNKIVGGLRGGLRGVSPPRELNGRRPSSGRCIGSARGLAWRGGCDVLVTFPPGSSAGSDTGGRARLVRLLLVHGAPIKHGFILVTAITFQVERSWLKAVSSANMPVMLVTAAVFHLEMSWLNLGSP